MTGPTAYKIGTTALSPLLPLWLRRRVARGKEDPSRLSERYGHASQSRPHGPLIWLHGASVGETQMIRPLIDRLLAADPARHILVTSGTVTSAQLLAKQLPERAIHQYLPADTPKATARFIDHWQPDLGVFAESDLWPNLIMTAGRADIPLALINARMSDKSLHGWRRRRALAKAVFEPFKLLLAADDRTATGLSDLTGHSVPMIGSLKYDAPPLRFDKREAERLQAVIGDRPIWLAASTHLAEEAVFHRLRKDFPDACLIWLPRHPDRGAAISETSGLPLRSRGEIPTPAGYVMDTLGEMGLALALADICVLGGSFHDSLMGHNPLEAARAGVPILSGANMASFADLYAAMRSARATLIVAEPALADHIRNGMDGLLSDMADRAKAFAAAQTGALNKTVAALEALL
jgi:3-deoxy-D-manno-octulosonic-acid transferase